MDVAATTPEDLAQYSSSTNTRVRWDGRLELTSKNEISNGDLSETDKDGRAYGTRMDAPDAPAGWGITEQLLTPSPGLETIQTLTALPMEREAYTQIGPIIRGPAIPDANDRAKIARPLAPRAEIISDALGGFQVGWIAIAYGWIVADTPKPKAAHVARSPYITEPSPRFYLQITADGEYPDVGIPTKAPKNVVGIYLATTAPQSTQNAASIAQLWIQRRIDVREAQQLTYGVTGPFSREEKAPATNMTLVGGFKRWGAPDRDYQHTKGGVMYSFSTRLTYRFATAFGISLPQDQTVEFHSSHIGEHKVLRWRPRKLPGNAIQWQPVFKRGDAYYGLPWRDLSEWVAIRSNDPEKIKAKTEKIQYADTGRDGTGIPAPDAEIEEVTKKGKPQMAVGDYRARAFWYDDDLKKSPPSTPAQIYDPTSTNFISKLTIASLGQTLRIFRPQFGNAIPNGHTQAVDRTTANQDPIGWTITRTANFTSILTDLGQIKVVDSSANTLTETFAQTPFTDIMADEPDDRWYTIRMGVNVSRYVSGRVSFRVLYFDKAKALLSTGATLGSIGGPTATKQYILNDTVHVSARIAKGSAVLPSGVVRDEAIPATARFFKVEARAVGQTAGTLDGPRNMDYVVTGLGSMRGLVVPRRMPLRLRPVPDIENYEDFYPPGGYAAIEVNPRNSKKHSDLAGKTLNAFIYFGPYGTPSDQTYGIRGLPTPVKPGTTKRYSVYAEYEGVYQTTNALKLVCKNRQGEIVADYGYLIPSASGSIAPTRFSKTLAIPDGPKPKDKGVTVEIEEGGLADGFWRIMAFQQEPGSSTTAWTNAYASSGSRSWIFDLGAPDVEEGSEFEFLSTVQKISENLTAFLDGSEPTNTDFAGTSVTSSFRISSRKDPYIWSASQTNPALLPMGKYLEVTVNLASSNILLSPFVRRAGVEIFRPFGVLLTEDGAEFPAGGCRLMSFPIVSGARKQTEFISDSNLWTQYISGEWLYRMGGVALHCPTREAAEAVAAYRYSKRAFVLESLQRNRRLVGYATSDLAFTPVEDGVSPDPLAPDGLWDEQELDGAEFVIMEEDTIR